MRLTLWLFGAEVFAVQIGPGEDDDTPLDHEVSHYVVTGFRQDEASHLPDREIGTGEEDV